MAKRRRQTAVVVRPQFGGFRPAAPVVIRQTRTVVKKKKSHRRRSGHESSSLTSKENMGLATGALVLGFIDRQGVKVPSIPILGRAGTIAAAGMLVGKHMHLPIATRVG